MVVQEDTISTADFTCSGTDLTGAEAALGFGAGNLSHSALTLVHSMRHYDQIAVHHFAQCQHSRELFLDELELGKWLTKLVTRNAIFQGCLIGTGGDTCFDPGDAKSRFFENNVGTCGEIFRVSEPVVIGNEDIVIIDVGIMNTRHGEFVLDH